MTAVLLVVFATPKPAPAQATTFLGASVGNSALGVPLLASTMNQPLLASTVAWLIAVAAMVAVLVLRLLEPRAQPSWSAPFVVRDLEISPKELRPGNRATVSVTVNNRGQHAGTFKVILKVDGIAKAEQEVTLASGMTERVEFSVPVAQPGPIAVSIGGLFGVITVIPA